MENSSDREVGANQPSAAKAGALRGEMTRQERHDMVWLRDAVLPEDGPPDDIYRLAVPILCEMTHEDLAAKLGPEYACGVAYGIERGSHPCESKTGVVPAVLFDHQSSAWSSSGSCT